MIAIIYGLQVRPITIANLQKSNISKYKENFERYSTFGTELAVKDIIIGLLPIAIFTSIHLKEISKLMMEYFFLGLNG